MSISQKEIDKQKAKQIYLEKQRLKALLRKKG